MLQPLGEVIYTSTAEILGQSLPETGSFLYGSFVLAGKEFPCVAVVFNVETTSIDPHRRPMALGLPEEQIPQNFPYLSHLLRNQFQALLIGELHENGFYNGLPASPPAMHAQIRAASDSEIRRISQNLGFLRLLYNSGKSPVEELLAGVCRTLIRAHNNSREEMIRIGKAVSALYRDDYDTLRRLIGRLESKQ